MSAGGSRRRAAGFGLAPPRRQPPPADDAGRAELVAAIGAEIERDGPITFARFMERALYEPGLGYYAAGAERPTRGGDFLTAPELHPLFGHALARQIDQAFALLDRPEPFVVREYGAGSGTLALTLLEGLSGLRSAALAGLRYQPLEIPGRGDALRRRLAEAGHGHVVDAAGEGAFSGCVVANEFVDALPVHRVVMRHGRLRELYVDWRAGRFGAVEGNPSSDSVEAWFADGGVELADGQVAEVNLRLIDWLAEVGRTLERGYVFVFDYGAEPADLYAPSRRAGTLRAFREHHVSGDPFVGVGEQDLTAHVDFGALRRAASAAGLEVLGTTSQAEFLMGCGLEELVTAAQASLPDEWPPRLELRAAVARLLDPRHLGGYRVAILGRNAPASGLAGLSYRLPARG